MTSNYGECEVYGYLNDDIDDGCENCWIFRDANNS
jgi:hypothetical protein